MISQLRQLCALCLDEYLKLIFFFLLLGIFEVLYRPSWEHKSYFPGKVSLFFLPFLPSCLAIHYPQLLSFEGPVVPLIGLCGQNFKQLQNSLISSTWPSCPPWKILMYPSLQSLRNVNQAQCSSNSSVYCQAAIQPLSCPSDCSNRCQTQGQSVMTQHIKLSEWACWLKMLRDASPPPIITNDLSQTQFFYILNVWES